MKGGEKRQHAALGALRTAVVLAHATGGFRSTAMYYYAPDGREVRLDAKLVETFVDIGRRALGDAVEFFGLEYCKAQLAHQGIRLERNEVASAVGGAMRDTRS
jgi:hypothetical protein